MKISFIISVIAVTLSAQSLLAADVDKRQDRQQTRIEQGIKNGELTAKEAYRLNKQQRKIAGTEKKFKSDGKFSQRERAIVQHQQNKASRNIFRQKHD